MPDNTTSSSFAATDFASTDSPYDPFAAGATPDGEVGASSAEAPAAPAPDPAAPDPVAELRRQVEELTPIKSELEKLQAERLREQQERAQGEYQQKQQATQQAIADWRRQLSDVFPPEQVDVFTQVAQGWVEAKEKVEYYDRMTPLWGQAVKGYHTYQEALQYLPETATIKDLKEFAGVLGGYTDPASMRQAAKMLSDLRGQAQGAQQQQARQQAINAGAGRIEGGAQMAPPGMSDPAIRTAFAHGQIPWSPKVQAALDRLAAS